MLYIRYEGRTSVWQNSQVCMRILDLDKPGTTAYVIRVICWRQSNESGNVRQNANPEVILQLWKTKGTQLVTSTAHDYRHSNSFQNHERTETDVDCGPFYSDVRYDTEFRAEGDEAYWKILKPASEKVLTSLLLQQLQRLIWHYKLIQWTALKIPSCTKVCHIQTCFLFCKATVMSNSIK